MLDRCGRRAQHPGHWKACRRKPLILSGSLRSGGRSMRVLQSRFCDEHHRASAGKSRIPPTTRSAASWRATSAGAPAMRAKLRGIPQLSGQPQAEGRQHRWRITRPTDYKAIYRPVRKKDSMQLLLGKPVYTDDITPKDALVVKILRSPHANAMVSEINTSLARKVPGVVAVLHLGGRAKRSLYHRGHRLTRNPPPYDRLILDRHVRFAGDAVRSSRRRLRRPRSRP